MMTGKLSPSMMCADFAQLPQTICEFEKGGVEYLHIDIMDGEFVSNFTLGTDFCTGLRQMTRIPLDIHLMINRPDLKISWFKVQPGEFVSVHWESTPHIQRTLAMIREAGGKPMLALNPATPVAVLDYVVGDIDGVLLMTVNPGFAGQKLIPAMLEKIQRTRAYLDAHGRKDASIEVDGNVSFVNAEKMRQAGADIFVGGTSSIFGKDDTLSGNIQRLRLAVK